MAVNLAAAAAGAMVIVNTVVVVQGQFGLTQQDSALALAAFGGGSMISALALPSLLDRFPERPVMLGAAAIAVALMIAGAMVSNFPMLMILWAMVGASYSAALTPSGRLLRRSTHPEDRPAVFAAQFALSHACWLLTYPLVGWLGATFGMGVAFIAMAAIGAIGLAMALRVWPRSDPEVITHVHHDLDAGDPHIADAEENSRGFRHAHAYVIDADHAAWPAR